MALILTKKAHLEDSRLSVSVDGSAGDIVSFGWWGYIDTLSATEGQTGLGKDGTGGDTVFMFVNSTPFQQIVQVYQTGDAGTAGQYTGAAATGATWTHYVVVYDSTTGSEYASLYINGSLAGTEADIESVFTDPLVGDVIGARPELHTNFFLTGRIAERFVYQGDVSTVSGALTALQTTNAREVLDDGNLLRYDSFYHSANGPSSLGGRYNEVFKGWTEGAITYDASLHPPAVVNLFDDDQYYHNSWTGDDIKTLVDASTPGFSFPYSAPTTSGTSIQWLTAGAASANEKMMEIDLPAGISHGDKITVGIQMTNASPVSLHFDPRFHITDGTNAPAMWTHETGLSDCSNFTDNGDGSVTPAGSILPLTSLGAGASGPAANGGMIRLTAEYTIGASTSLTGTYNVETGSNTLDGLDLTQQLKFAFSSDGDNEPTEPEDTIYQLDYLTITINGATTYNKLINDQNAQCHLKFDETSGTTATDATSNSNDGTLVSTPSDDTQWTTGRIGGACNRDAAGRIDIAHDATISGTTYTVAIWYKPDATPASLSTLLAKSDASNRQFVIYHEDDDTIYFTTKLGASIKQRISTTTVTPGEWTHLAMTCDGTTVKAYMDGVQEGADLDVTSGVGTTTSSIFLNSGTLIATTFDDFLYFDRVLSDSELATLHAAGSTITVGGRADPTMSHGLSLRL